MYQFRRGLGVYPREEQLLTDYLRVLGAGHNHTLGTRRALARWRGEAGDAECND
ncbi:MAG: hypothetical protein ACRDTA_04940 [Pseudonocardiaceae bacterium]